MSFPTRASIRCLPESAADNKIVVSLLTTQPTVRQIPHLTIKMGTALSYGSFCYEQKGGLWLGLDYTGNDVGAVTRAAMPERG